MGTPGPGDPFDWTVDQVVSYLCHTSSEAWSKSSAPTVRPDPATFGRALQENDVNGEILLTEISRETLQQDLGVKSLGQRSSIFSAVQQLRQQSIKYQQHNAASHPTLHPSPQVSWPPHLSRGSISPVASHLGFYDQSPHAPPLVQNAASLPTPVLPGSTITPTPFQSVHQSPRQDAPPEFPHSNNTGRKLPESGFKQMEKGESRIPKRSPVDTTRYPEQSLNSTNQSHAAQREQHVIDGHGRKRRRLNLGHPVAANAATNAIRRPYIGRDKVSATDIFYKSSPQDEDEDNFLVTRSDVPMGKRLFVNKLMKHYLQQQPHYLGVNGRKQILGVIPYSRSFSQLGEKHYFTLFTPEGKKIQVSKEEVDQWPQLRGDSSLGSSMIPRRPPPENDPYGRFLWRYAHEDDREVSLPPLGDSGSEGGYDSDTWNEMEEERQMKGKATELQSQAECSKYLSTSEVNATIDDCLDTFSKNWDSNKLPVENRKAWHLWTLSRKKKTRKQQISDAKNSIDHLRKRLDRIRERIHDEQWTKVTELQTQCQCMEPSIASIKKDEWKISVLELSSCPQKPPRETVLRKQVKKPVQLYPDQEESLDSDSEDAFDDNLEDFVLPNTGTAETRPEDEMDIAPPLEDDENQKDNSQAVPSVSDSEDEIVGPMVYKKRRRLRRSGSDESQSVAQSSPATGTPRQKRRTSHTRHGTRSSNQTQLIQEDVEVVDLTQVDESPNENENGDTTGESGDIITPPLNPTTSPEHSLGHRFGMRWKSSSQSPISLYEKNQINPPGGTKDRESQSPEPPDLGDIDGISKLSWKYLEGRQDKRRVLMKLIAGLPDDARDHLYTFLPKARVSWFEMHAKAALEGLLLHKKSLQHLTVPENMAVMRIATLFIAWVECKKLSQKEGLDKTDIKSAQNQFGDFSRFFESLSKGIEDFYAYHDTSNNPEADDDSDLHGTECELGDAAKSTPHKKRKKAVKQNQEVIHTQKSGQQRVKLQQIQQSRLAEKTGNIGVRNNDPGRQAVSFESPVIYLDPHIGGRVKPHQLSGIQFMWREIMTDEKGTGCLLAHTMGLGKTMQVISLLVTMANAGASSDPKVRDQVPERLRKTRALILCPSSLIENWYDEFLMWTPRDSSTQNNIGIVRKIMSSQSMKLSDRFTELSAWDEEGGVLILSYDLFRNFVQNNAPKNKPAPLDDETHKRVRKQLLEGPSIIVADEAHKMKNKVSGVAHATAAFESKSRIALTGSPLANNLHEYYAMINWISPGYLGSSVEFKANYVEPIEEGLYSDSTPLEHRRSLKKLQVLKEDVSPKVNRADISVIQQDLPPKVEFVITVPLTEIQKKCYNLYVSSLLGNPDVPIGNARLWDWLSILSLCCNHPLCFRNKLREREKPGSKRKDKKGAVSPENSDLDAARVDVSGENVPESAAQEQLRLLSEVSTPLESLEYSYRAMIVTEIIEESIEVGDKVLLFSQTLATLDFMEEVLKKHGRNYSRLDGSTPMVTRQSSTKEFNNAGSDINVYLISTKAGGLGLNIPGANRVIIFDFSFNPTHEEQAVGRAYRIGQEKPVFVYRFLSGGTFEDIIYNKAVFKTQLSYRVVDKKNPIRWACRSPKDYLFHVKATKRKDLSELRGKDPHVLDKILAKQHNILSIGLTETFHREGDDKLTEEEEKEAQEELEDERLKRNDPLGWERKNVERRAREMAQMPQMAQMSQMPHMPHYQLSNPAAPMQMGFPSMRHISYPALPSSSHAPPPRTFGQGAGILPNEDPFVTHQQRGGPPPLAPDTSMHSNFVNSSRGGPREGSAATISGSSTIRNGSEATPPQSGTGKPDIRSNSGGQVDLTLKDNQESESSHERRSSDESTSPSSNKSPKCQQQ